MTGFERKTPIFGIGTDGILPSPAIRRGTACHCGKLPSCQIEPKRKQAMKPYGLHGSPPENRAIGLSWVLSQSTQSSVTEAPLSTVARMSPRLASGLFLRFLSTPFPVRELSEVFVVQRGIDSSLRNS